jgi:hypothetical protein
MPHREATRSHRFFSSRAGLKLPVPVARSAKSLIQSDIDNAALAGTARLGSQNLSPHNTHLVGDHVGEPFAVNEGIDAGLI